MAEVCVIGGGPAGSTYAARMAQLGHTLVLVEAACFPRRHLGESLTPGVLPMLETTGTRAAIERAGFTPVHKVHVNWGAGSQVRDDPRGEGLLVDRGEFDRLLLSRAREVGVQIHQPARASHFEWTGERWLVDIELEDNRVQIAADFLADATGRSAVTKGTRRRTASRTVALYAYWRGPRLPREPRMHATADFWSWGVPLPDGTYNTLVFVDVDRFRSWPPLRLADRFLRLLAESELMTGVAGAQLDGAVRAADATPWLHQESVTPWSIRIGDAALSIDPISSSGVQKAIGSALSGAIVTNTLLKRPESAGDAIHFYRSNLEQASTRHCNWAAGHYRTVAERTTSKFWQDRAAAPTPRQDSTPPRTVDDAELASSHLVLSAQAQFEPVPCLDGDFVTSRTALRHPNLETPVVWLGGRRLAPLLHRISGPATATKLALSWSNEIPFATSIAIVRWLLSHDVLVPAARVRTASNNTG